MHIRQDPSTRIMTLSVTSVQLLYSNDARSFIIFKSVWHMCNKSFCGPSAVRCRLMSSTTFCIHGWSSGAGYTAHNHWRPCSCHRRSTCLEQPSSRSESIPDIFCFQNTPEVTSVQRVLPFSLAVSLTILVQSPWSRLCCICVSKFVIITLHYVTQM